jgi:hypothetical protein
MYFGRKTLFDVFFQFRLRTYRTISAIAALFSSHHVLRLGLRIRRSDAGLDDMGFEIEESLGWSRSRKVRRSSEATSHSY